MFKDDNYYMSLAIAEAKKDVSKGAIPIGAVLVHNSTGEVLSRGHNQRIQKGSNVLHGETDCLENFGRNKKIGDGKEQEQGLKNCTMYTTLSPCDMCTGACLLYGIGRVVMGENRTFVGGEEYLKQRGVEVVNLDNEECFQMMQEFIKKYPEIWNEDIGK